MFHVRAWCENNNFIKKSENRIVFPYCLFFRLKFEKIDFWFFRYSIYLFFLFSLAGSLSLSLSIVVLLIFTRECVCVCHTNFAWIRRHFFRRFASKVKTFIECRSCNVVWVIASCVNYFGINILFSTNCKTPKQFYLSHFGEIYHNHCNFNQIHECCGESINFFLFVSRLWHKFH